MSERTRIVIIEDEKQIRRLLSASFEPSEVLISEAETGSDGIRLVASSNPDVVLLDLGLPDLDGIEVCRQLREWTQVPIIVLSARGQESDKIQALDAGADDYLTKPFSVGELQARIRVTLRHSRERKTPEGPTSYQCEDLRVDLRTRQVWLGGNEVHLTPIEYKILALLVANAGLVLTHRQILEHVWGPAYVDELHYLRVYMRQLRHKIEVNATKPQVLRTETGIGYRLRSEDSQ